MYTRIMRHYVRVRKHTKNVREPNAALSLFSLFGSQPVKSKLSFSVLHVLKLIADFVRNLI